MGQTGDSQAFMKELLHLQTQEIALTLRDAEQGGGGGDAFFFRQTVT